MVSKLMGQLGGPLVSLESLSSPDSRRQEEEKTG